MHSVAVAVAVAMTVTEETLAAEEIAGITETSTGMV